MTIEIKFVDPSPAQLRQLLAIMYPGLDLGTLAPRAIGDDNPETGTPQPSEAFGGSTVVAPEVATALAPSVPDAGGPSPEAAFGGNAAGAPTAPIAAAPVGTPAAPPPAPGASAPPGVTLDKNGLPWDARIHAKAATGGGTLNADGTWRAKRGLNDEALVKRIEAELRAVLAAPGPVAAGNVPLPPGASSPTASATPGASSPSPAAAPAQSVAAPPSPVPPAPDAGNVAPLPPAAIAAPPAPSVPLSPVGAPGLQPTSNYVELVQQIAAAMTAGKLNDTEITAACLEFGIPSLPLLGTRLDLVSSVSSRVNQILASKG